jgi:arginyl-tRNA synthetase
VKADDREFTANGDVEDYDNIRQFAVAYLRNEQDKDLQAFNLHFDEYYLESSLYTSGRVEATVNKLVANGKTRAGRRAVAQEHRLRRRQGPRHAQGRRHLHLLRARRGLPHRQVGARLHQGRQHPGHDHHGTIARVRAGLQAADVGIPQGYPDYVLHTMVRVVKGGEEVKISKRAGSYVTLRDLIEWTSKDAVRFFLLSRKPDTEYTFDVDLAVAAEQRQPGVLRAVRACAHLLGAHGLGWRRGRSAGRDLSALDGPQAQALMLQLAKYPEMLTAATEGEAPHDVTFYLRDLAASYHSYYDAERILVDDETVKRARLALVAATAQVLHNGLAVLGVSAPAECEW